MSVPKTRLITGDQLVRVLPEETDQSSLETTAEKVSDVAKDALDREAQLVKKIKEELTDEEKSLIAGTGSSRKVGLSREEGDEPTLHDKLFNYIPASCFEIGAALSILSKPGKAGDRIDGYADKLANVIKLIYENDEIGNQIVEFGGKKLTLREVLNQRLLKEISPTSDQIGRCRDRMPPEDPIERKLWLENVWFKEEGKDWLISILTKKSSEESHSYTDMLTKIRSLSAFGTILLKLIDKDAEKLESLLGKDPAAIRARLADIKANIRHEGFDSPKTRARSEKPPIIEGKSLSDYSPAIEKKKASDHNLGFGDIYVPESFPPEHSVVRKKYIAEEESKGRGALKRQGEVIDNPSKRPGITTHTVMKKMPKAFEDAGLREKLEEHEFSHGTGINRWQLKGTYPQQSLSRDLPVAGAHSGGVADILTAVHCLSDESVLGDGETALSVGLLASSFMNFGGYHSFVETFPIAQAFAKGTGFRAEVTDAQRTLYEDFQKAAESYAESTAVEEIQKYKEAYDRSLA